MINRIIVRLFSGILLLSCISIRAQDLQLAGFSFTRLPGAGVKDAPLNREIEINEYNFFVNLPKPLKNEKTVLVNGLRYTLVTPFANNDVTINIDDQNLHLVGYSLMVLHQLKNQWALLILLNPALSSTFNQPLESDDFLLNGTLQFIKKKSERISYGGGMLATSRFGDPILLPTIQLTLQSEKTKLKVFLPQSISYDYLLGKFSAGIQVAVDGSLYNVNYSRTSVLNEVQPVDRVGYTRVVFGPSFRYRLGKMIRLEASGGLSLAQQIELQGNLFEDDTFELDNGTFFQFGIAVVPPQKAGE